MKAQLVKIVKYWLIIAGCWLVLGHLGAIHPLFSLISGPLMPLNYYSSLRATPKSLLDFSEGQGLSCNFVTATIIIPKPTLTGDSLKTAIVRKDQDGNTKYALKIEGNKIKFMLSTTLEQGDMEPLELTILENNENGIWATTLESALSSIVHSLLLDKNTGFAIWTKSNSVTPLMPAPYTLTYFLKCEKAL